MDSESALGVGYLLCFCTVDDKRETIKVEIVTRIEYALLVTPKRALCVGLALDLAQTVLARSQEIMAAGITERRQSGGR